MPPETLYVTTHIHTDGPIPGPHSLLTLASAAHAASGALTSTFTANLRELPGATLHPAALTNWRTRAEDWLTTRRAAKPPALVATAYARWVSQLPGPAVFVSDPDEPDHHFCFWYLHRFAGRWPFVRSTTTADVAAPGRFTAETLCALSGCRALVPAG